MPDSPAVARQFRRTVTVCVAGAIVLALAGLLGQHASLQLLGSVRASYIPMAPGTAAAILLCSAALFLHTRRTWRGAGRLVMATLVLLMTAYCLLVVLSAVTGLDLAFEHRLTRGFGTLGRIPLGRMSPVSGGTLALVGMGTFLLMLHAPSSRRARHLGHVAAALGFSAVLIAGTVMLAYLYGAPFLYEGTAVPMALTSAVGVVLLGAALVAAAGPASLPLRLMVGDSTSARLSRAFLPLPIAVVLIQSVLERFDLMARTANSPLVLAGLIVFSGAVTFAVVTRLAHATSISLDERTRLVEESAARMRAITQSATDAIITASEAGIIVEWNPAAEAIFGYAASEATGKPLIALMPEEFHSGHSAGLRRVAEGGAPHVIGQTVELMGRRKDGTDFPMELSLSMWTDSSGRHFSGIIRDITERKNAAAERAATQEHLASLQKMESVGLLAGGVAHEFNNMLSAILGHAELTLRKLDEGHIARVHVEAIQRAAQRSADLSRQLLVFARRQAIQVKVQDLNETVAGIVDVLRAMLGEHVRVEWSPGSALWPVAADAVQIDQVLAALALNARDAMAGREGVLHLASENFTVDAAFAAAHRGIKAGDYVCLRVRDNGTGMDAPTLARIFEPFFTTKEPGKGTGLGLPTVLGVMQQHGGYVDVTSTPGVGTLFVLHLPRAAVSTPAIEERGADARRGAATVLLVEDDASVLAFAGELLRTVGYSVLAARDGAEALEKAASHTGAIDLLLTDVVMPGMNGPQLAALLRARCSDLKVLYLSGYDPDELVAKHGLDANAPLLRKPFSLAALSVACAASIGRAR